MSVPVVAFTIGALRAIAFMRSFIGYREGPGNNENRFGAHYGWNFVAWCVQAAWCSADETGSGGGVPKTASTGAAMRWAKSVGRWHEIPQPGDWSIMVNSRGETIHTDVVESYNPAKQELICIGGNTSGSYGGSVHEGNGVYRNNRWRKWKAGRIIGFVRPLYGVSPEAVKIVQRAEGIKADGKYGPATRAAVQRIQTRYGLKADGFPGPKTIAAITGEDVAETIPPAVDDIVDGNFDDVDVTQRRLTDLGYGPLEVDGKYGPITAAATKQYQTDMGIEADGRPGPATRSHMEDTMAKIDDILTKLDALPKLVWGIGGGPHAPMIGRRLEKGSEYPETTLGSMTDRIVRQQLVPLRGEVAGLSKAVQQLAAGKGIDPEEIRKAVAAGVDDALGNLEVTVSKDS